MRYMVFSDVHGNLPALRLALQDAGSVDGYICLGDTVDYGPWSNECVDIIRTLPNIVFVRGNHEEDFLSGSHTGDNVIANAFFDFCLPRFQRFDAIKDLPQTFELNGFTFRHTILDSNIYPDSKLELNDNYVIGHSHHQFTIEQPPFRLINSGSIGQNRKYINVINYLLLDSDTMDFTLRAITYDVEQVLAEMRRQGYPDICVNYYNDKQRLVA